MPDSLIHSNCMLNQASLLSIANASPLLIEFPFALEQFSLFFIIWFLYHQSKYVIIIIMMMIMIIMMMIWWRWRQYIWNRWYRFEYKMNIENCSKEEHALLRYTRSNWVLINLIAQAINTLLIAFHRLYASCLFSASYKANHDIWIYGISKSESWPKYNGKIANLLTRFSFPSVSRLMFSFLESSMRSSGRFIYGTTNRFADLGYKIEIG